MAKVICNLPNAADKINGVAFTAVDGAMVSEDIADDVAANFCLIPGYRLVGSKKTEADAAAKAKAEADAAAAAKAEADTKAKAEADAKAKG